MDEYQRRYEAEKKQTENLYRQHQGHEVEYECYEGGLYRLFCLTCKTFVDIIVFLPKTLGRFIWR